MPINKLVLALLLAPAPALCGEITGAVKAPGAASGDVVVYLEKARADKAPAAPARMVSKNTQFAPRLLVVRKGQRIEFPNEDKGYHNAFSVTPGNEFDVGLYRGGESRSAELREPGEVEVYCNVHPDMTARVLVLDNGHFARADAGGAYRIADVPPGGYTVVAWSPGHQPQRRRVEVTAAAPARADFALVARAAAGPHLNKNGEQYGRYK